MSKNSSRQRFSCALIYVLYISWCTDDIKCFAKIQKREKYDNAQNLSWSLLFAEMITGGYLDLKDILGTCIEQYWNVRVV